MAADMNSLLAESRSIVNGMLDAEMCPSELDMASIRTIAFVSALPPRSLDSTSARSINFLLKNRPTSRLNEIVLEILASAGDDIWPCEIARESLAEHGTEIARTTSDFARAEHFLSYAAEKEMKAALTLYLVRTAANKTHAEAYAKIPDKWKPDALRFLAENPAMRGGGD